MHEVAGAPLGFAAAGFAGFSFSMAATRFVGDRFTRRFGPVRVLAGGAGLAGRRYRARLRAAIPAAR